MGEVFDYFADRIDRCRAAGITDLALDPGFGFGKTLAHNYALLDGLSLFRSFGFPVMAGLSRKSMIQKVLAVEASEALNGTTVLNTVALMKGADILRVHDVREACEVVRLVAMLPRPE